MVNGTCFTRGTLLALALALGSVLLPVGVEANHPVLVEGNNATNAGPGATLIQPRIATARVTCALARSAA